MVKDVETQAPEQQQRRRRMLLWGLLAAIVLVAGAAIALGLVFGLRDSSSEAAPAPAVCEPLANAQSVGLADALFAHTAPSRCSLIPAKPDPTGFDVTATSSCTLVSWGATIYMQMGARHVLAPTAATPLPLASPCRPCPRAAAAWTSCSTTSPPARALSPWTAPLCCPPPAPWTPSLPRALSVRGVGLCGRGAGCGTVHAGEAWLAGWSSCPRHAARRPAGRAVLPLLCLLPPCQYPTQRLMFNRPPFLDPLPLPRQCRQCHHPERY